MQLCLETDLPEKFCGKSRQRIFNHLYQGKALADSPDYKRIMEAAKTKR